MTLEHFKKALHPLPEGIRHGSIDIQRESCTWAQIKNGTLQGAGNSTQYGVYAFAGARGTGCAYTQDILEAPEALLAKAAENSLPLENEKPFYMTPPEAAAPSQPWHSHQPDPELLLKTGATLEKAVAAQVSFPLEMQLELRLDTMSSRVFNSIGLDASASNQFYSLSINAAAQWQGQQVNTVAAHTALLADQLSPALLAQRIQYALERQLKGGRLPSGSYPAVVDSSVAINILTTAWQLFSGVKYAEGTSAISGKLGQALFSPALTITDQPQRPGTGYAYSIDCEGTPCTAAPLVSGGVFSGLLHTRATAAALGNAPTGNSGRRALLTGAIPTAVIPIPRIVCIKADTASQAQLLKAMGNGVLISESYDVFHSINIASGDFSIPCRGAVVENGQIKNNVTEMTLAGNLMELFSSIEQCGHDLDIQEFLLKSYCIGAPSLRLSSIRVNG